MCKLHVNVFFKLTQSQEHFRFSFVIALGAWAASHQVAEPSYRV